jgi:hypothetical protein
MCLIRKGVWLLTKPLDVSLAKHILLTARRPLLFMGNILSSEHPRALVSGSQIELGNFCLRHREIRSTSRNSSTEARDNTMLTRRKVFSPLPWSSALHA